MGQIDLGNLTQKSRDNYVEYVYRVIYDERICRAEKQLCTRKIVEAHMR